MGDGLVSGSATVPVAGLGVSPSPYFLEMPTAAGRRAALPETVDAVKMAMELFKTLYGSSASDAPAISTSAF